jgi:F0F1-type ATP synthase membrane subunit a
MGYFSHYTTLATPLGLIPFIKLIEVVRKIIRPITLGVRLAVKLLTGHLLLSMYSTFHRNQLLKISFFSYCCLCLLGVCILFYETCISLIQAFVYKLMIIQYLDEHSI